jgi:hypothetical protein
MNRHSRQKFYAELDAYAAFFSEAHKDDKSANDKKPSGDCSEARLFSIVDRIKRYTD